MAEQGIAKKSEVVVLFLGTRRLGIGRTVARDLLPQPPASVKSAVLTIHEL